MTKPAIQLDKPPMNLQDKETKLERLSKLKRFLQVEQMQPVPCVAYIEDLGLSIIRLQNE